MADRVLHVIFSAVDEVNLQRVDDEPLIKDVDSILVGETGQLDSLALVHFVLAVEQKFEEVFGRELSLSDEVVMERWGEIFQTIGSLNIFLCGQLDADQQ